MIKVAANGQDSYTLIVCEKPSSAKRIADALTNSANQIKNETKYSPFFSVIDKKGQNTFNDETRKHYANEDESPFTDNKEGLDDISFDEKDNDLPPDDIPFDEDDNDLPTNE